MKPELRERIMRRAEWYHTLELAPGLVTPGWFDTRSVVPLLPLPSSLAGQRALDVGTFDGFWAFELERRGATEVVAVDVPDPREWDWPAGSGDAVREVLNRRRGAGDSFAMAAEALGSRAERRELSVYALSPEAVGEFAFAYIGSLLLHLRDPVSALAAVRSVAREALLVDAYDPGLDRLARGRPIAELDAVGRPWWWWPNVAALKRMAEAAGWRVAAEPIRFRMPPGAGFPRAPLRPSLLFSRAGRRALSHSRWGDPHVALRLARA